MASEWLSQPGKSLIGSFAAFKAYNSELQLIFSNFLLKLDLKMPSDCSFLFIFTDSIDPRNNSRCEDDTAAIDTQDICNSENVTDNNESGGDEKQCKITNNCSFFFYFEAIDDSTDELVFHSWDTEVLEELRWLLCNLLVEEKNLRKLFTIRVSVKQVHGSRHQTSNK